MRMTKRPKIIMLVGAALLVSVLLIAGFLRGQDKYPDPAALAAATPYKNTFFDPDPNHPWNQLYGMLFIRPAWDGKLYGLDEMDPLYWNSSRYLLEGPVHQKALAVLDRFIQSDSAHLIKDPLKRALLQHTLWALFDTWSAHFDPFDSKSGTFDVERRELQMRLAKIMRALALTDDEMQALPHNYDLQVAAKTYPTEFDLNHEERPFLPVTFFAGKDWVELDGTNYDLFAPVHVAAVSGRSAFHVFISLPGGRSETLAYLKKLHDFQPHWVYDGAHRAMTRVDNSTPQGPWANSDTPQVPLLTKFALVRTMQVINANGEPRSTPLMESVQMRVIRSIYPGSSSGGDQSLFLFRLDQKKLLSGEGGLVAKSKTDLVFDMVLGAGSEDSLQGHVGRGGDSKFHGESAELNSCMGCHDSPGIFSMNSYIQFFQNNRTLQPPDLREGDDADWSSEVWKGKQYNWGLLQAYWFMQ